MRIKFLVITAVLITAVFAFGSPAAALTVEELQAQIQALLQQIAALQAQLAQQQGGNQPWCHTFARNLGYVNSGSSEVGELKTALIKDGVWPNEAVTYDYDEETMAYIVKFQMKHGIIATGYVGPLTRAKLNALFGCNTAQACVNGETKSCANGTGVQACVDGHWNNCVISATCVDTDNGKDYYTKGTVTSGGKTYTDLCYADTGKVFEYYCNSDGTSTGEYYACPNGCENGACKQLTTQPSITVTSPNGGETWKVGKTYAIKWSTTGYSSSDVVQIRLTDARYPNAPGGETTIVIETPNAGTYNWTVPSSVVPTSEGAGPTHKIKIYIMPASAGGWGGLNDSNDSSDNYFTIAAASGAYKSSPSFTASTVPSNQTLISGMNSTLYSFNVAANASGDIALKQLKFDITANPHGGTVAGLNNFRFFRGNVDITNNVNIQKATGVSLESTNNIATGDNFVYVTFEAEEQVPAGNYYTYTLKAYNVGTLDSVVTSLQADTVSSTNHYLSADSTNSVQKLYSAPNNGALGSFANIIWSDLSATPHDYSFASSSGDWYNGFGLSGLPLGEVKLYGEMVAQPSITVTSPNGGETWKGGETHNITWTYNGTNPLMIELCRDSISTCWTLAYNVLSTQKSYSWIVNSVLPIGSENQSSAAGGYKVHVQEQMNASISDSSNNYFTIAAATVKLTAASATLTGNQSTYTAGQTIKFSMEGVASDGSTPDFTGKGFNVQAYMYDANNKIVTVNGTTQGFNAVFNYVTNLWDVTMTAPSDASQTYKISASFYCSSATPGYCTPGLSSSPQIDKSFTFTVSSAAQPSISSVAGPASVTAGESGIWTVTAVDPNNSLTIGAGTTITLDSSAATSTTGGISGSSAASVFSVAWGDGLSSSQSNYTITGQTSTGTTKQATLTHSYAKAGSYTATFTFKNDAGQTATKNVSVNVASAVVQPTVKVVSPVGGGTWKQGQTVRILWSSTGLAATDKINISIIDYTNLSQPVTKTVISGLAGNLLSYIWSIPPTFTASSKYKMKIDAYVNGVLSASDNSDNYFTIAAASTTASSLSDIQKQLSSILDIIKSLLSK